MTGSFSFATVSSFCRYHLLNPVDFFSVALKDIKAFLPRINCKISTTRLREAFQEVDTRKRNEVGFDDFTTLHNKLIFDETVSYQSSIQVISSTSNQLIIFSKIIEILFYRHLKKASLHTRRIVKMGRL